MLIFELGLELINKLLPLKLVEHGQNSGKNISAKPADDAADAADYRIKRLGNIAKQHIALMLSVKVIDNVEVFNINTYDIKKVCRVMLDNLRRESIERFLRIKGSQRISFNGVYKGSIFAHSDDVCNAVANYFGLIRLCNEVCRSRRKRLHLILLTVHLSCNYNGNISRLRNAAVAFKESVAIHNRHDNIKNDKGNTSCLIHKDFQCIKPVFSLDHIKAVREYLGNNHAVDGTIVNNHDLSSIIHKSATFPRTNMKLQNQRAGHIICRIDSLLH